MSIFGLLFYARSWTPQNTVTCSRYTFNICWEISVTIALFKLLRDKLQLHTLEVRFPVSRWRGKMLLSYSIALYSILNILTGLPVSNYVRAPFFIRRSRFSQKHKTHRHPQTQSTQTYYTKILNLIHTQELNYGIFKTKVIVPAFDCAMISVSDNFMFYVFNPLNTELNPICQ